MALVPLEGSRAETWEERVSLACNHCDVTWRGIPMEPCWLCGSVGLQPAGTTLVRD